MVKRWALSSLSVLLLTGPALAEPDWRDAGGAIFAAPLGSNPTPVPPSATKSVSLSPASQPFERAVGDAAARHRIDPKLLHALVTVESAYRPRAVSTAGAGGLTQLMPGTAKTLGVSDRFDPAGSLDGGADYLARQLTRFGDLRLALAAYNAGPERVAQLGRVPEIRETQAYVSAVVDCYLALTAGRSVRTSRDCRGPAHE